MSSPDLIAADAVYHVPRSQVWEGSRSRQSGCMHLHVVSAVNGGRLSRAPGQALCGKRGWYERPADGDEPACPRCLEMAPRYGVRVPVGFGCVRVPEERH